MRISAAASGTFRQRTNAFVRRADLSKSAGSRVRTYSHCPSCRDNAAIRPDYRNAPKASILILTPMCLFLGRPPDGSDARAQLIVRLVSAVVDGSSENAPGDAGANQDERDGGNPCKHTIVKHSSIRSIPLKRNAQAYTGPR